MLWFEHDLAPKLLQMFKTLSRKLMILVLWHYWEMVEYLEGRT